MSRPSSVHNALNRHNPLRVDDAEPWSELGLRVLAALDEAVEACDRARDVARLTVEVASSAKKSRAA